MSDYCWVWKSHIFSKMYRVLKWCIYFILNTDIKTFCINLDVRKTKTIKIHFSANSNLLFLYIFGVKYWEYKACIGMIGLKLWFYQYLLNTNIHGFLCSVDPRNVMFIEKQILITYCIKKGSKLANFCIQETVIFIISTTINSH